MVLTRAALVALALAACAPETPESVARAFIAASRAADKEAMWQLLGPATRARLLEAADAATEKVGGARRYGPLDMLDVAISDSTYAPTDVVARIHGDRASVDVLGPDGHHDVLELLHAGHRWRVELP